MQKLLSIFLASTLIAGSISTAMAEGDAALYHAPTFNDGSIYFGAFLGYGNNHWSNINNMRFNSGYHGDSNLTNITSINNNGGFAWNLYLGYNINQYIGLQLDYSRFRNTTINGFYRTATSPMSNTYSEYAVTGSIVTEVPVFDTGFNLYAQLGLNYLRATVSGTVSSNITSSIVKPAYGAGIKYDFGNDISVKTGWIHFTGNNAINSKSYIPSIDMYGMGLTYTFVL